MAKATIFKWEDTNTEITFYDDWRIWVYWSGYDCNPESCSETFVSYTIPAEEVDKLISRIIEANPGIVFKVNHKEREHKILENDWWNDLNKFIFSLINLAFNDTDSYRILFKFLWNNWIKYENFIDFR